MLMQQIICADGVIRTKLDIAIQRFKSFEPPEGYYLAFSGGKDSQCIAACTTRSLPASDVLDVLSLGRNNSANSLSAILNIAKYM